MADRDPEYSLKPLPRPTARGPVGSSARLDGAITAYTAELQQLLDLIHQYTEAAEDLLPGQAPVGQGRRARRVISQVKDMAGRVVAVSDDVITLLDRLERGD